MGNGAKDMGSCTLVKRFLAHGYRKAPQGNPCGACDLYRQEGNRPDS